MMQRSVFQYASLSNVILSIFKRTFGGSAALMAEIETGQQESVTVNSLVGRDFLSMKDLKADEIKQILWTAKDLKTRIKNNGEVFLPLKGKTAALIFHKTSMRTRVSTELGLARLGGHAAFLGPEHFQLGGNEITQDTARVLAGMADIILACVTEQQVLNTLADEAIIPVISGMSDLLHPLQTLADFMTIQEHFGYLRGNKIAWVGDGNSVLHSLMHGCAKLGIDLSVATPVGHEPEAEIMIETLKLSGKTGASFQMGSNLLEAVHFADVIITDTWLRAGEGEGKEKRLADFQGYQVNRKILKDAGANWVFLHCLPRKMEEVTDDVFYGEESLVWQQAENRMWTVMAVMLQLLQAYTPTISMPKYVRG